MSNDYFNPTSLTAHTRALASALNTLFTAVQTGFGYLPSRDDLRRETWLYALDTGAANVYTVTRSDTDSTLVTGMKVRFTVGAGNTNTGACTVDVDGLGATAIKLITGSDPAAGDLTAGDPIELVYDGTNFVITSAVRSQFT